MEKVVFGHIGEFCIFSPLWSDGFTERIAEMLQKSLDPQSHSGCYGHQHVRGIIIPPPPPPPESK